MKQDPVIEAAALAIGNQPPVRVRMLAEKYEIDLLRLSGATLHRNPFHVEAHAATQKPNKASKVRIAIKLFGLGGTSRSWVNEISRSTVWKREKKKFIPRVVIRSSVTMPIPINFVMIFE
ncbi:hypothetical protein AVEN_167561-1 [Araneus ventricosus]|uniref:Uncharacterized protein n=1 Tax=Araneus ventricosus TaxID=182803 RepID=A0A4Y2LV13_ARAVE|nr:hypothetical protein AVEN_174582-1 [Araneus ventricosus]GBN18372.1 hypothetical protein AVEN_167561-1 [Araneus ventricosus]